MSSGIRSRPQSKLRRLVTAPYRALRRARDFYVNSMAGCASEAQRAPFVPMPRARSFGFRQPRGGGSEDHDIGGLINGATASTRSLPIKAEKGAAVPRSQSVAAMRIDEDRPCTFVGDVKVGLGARPYPRSRSCAVVVPGRAVSVSA